MLVRMYRAVKDWRVCMYCGIMVQETDKTLCTEDDSMPAPKTPKRPFLPQILCGLLLSFTLFVFAPIDMYLLNSNNVWFRMEHFVPLFLGLFAASFVLIEIAYLLFRKLPYPVYLLLLSGLFGLGLLFYLQGNYLCMGNEVLFGNMPVWNEMLGSAGINLLIWMAVLLISAIAILLKPKVVMRAMSALCALVLVMEGTALVVSISRHRPSEELGSVYCSVADRFTYSQNGDVLVYMMDTLDSRLMDRIWDEDPDFVSELDGFTYYRNTSSSYCMTHPSFVSMLTGELCRNEEPFFIYSHNAFAKSRFFPTLLENGMTINVYAAPQKVFSTAQMEQVSNLRVRESEVLSYPEFAGNMMKMIAYRYAPQLMQPFVFDQYDKAFSVCQKYSDDLEPEMQKDDIAFFGAFKDSDVQIDNSRRFFKYYVMQGAHSPFLMNRHAEWVQYNSSEQYEQTLGAFTILETMFEELKRQGVYDSSTIIILGDHGINDEDGRICNPAFLVKYPNETTDGELQISDAPIELLDLRATVLYGAGINHDAFGRPAHLWEEGEERERYFMEYVYTTPGGYDFYLSNLTEYAVPEDATDLVNYEPTGNVY